MNRSIQNLTLLLLCILAMSVFNARAEIVISGPGQQSIPLALNPTLPTGTILRPEIASTFHQTLQNDLDASGIFALADPRAFLSDAGRTGLTSAEVDFSQWRKLSVDLLVKSAYTLSNDELVIDARLYDVPLASLLAGRRYRGHPGDERQMAHAFADQILKALTGKEGSFAGRILFVVKKGKEKELYSMESDGQNLLPLTAHRALILNPDAAPQSREVVFTSYVSGRPELYRKEIYSGREVKISSRRGVNIGARYSPDGRNLAASLSFEGNSELYLLTPDGQIVKRLTNNWGIDVDPSWSPDGRKIAFVSDRSGNPQIYILDLQNDTTSRLTYNGKYNTSPSWSPDGEEIVFARLQDGQFDLFSIRPDGSGEIQLTTGGGNKEHPRWSPDGRFLLYTIDNGSRSIWRMRSDGSAPQRISPPGVDGSHPVWSKQ